MTNEQEQWYLSHKGMHCPFCHNREVETKQVEICEGFILQAVDCVACGKEWTDNYTLTGTEEVQEV